MATAGSTGGSQHNTHLHLLLCRKHAGSVSAFACFIFFASNTPEDAGAALGLAVLAALLCCCISVGIPSIGSYTTFEVCALNSLRLGGLLCLAALVWMDDPACARGLLVHLSHPLAGSLLWLLDVHQWLLLQKRGALRS